MLADLYGEILDINGQDNYLSNDLFDDYVEEEELDCRKENNSIYCEPAVNDYDYDTLPV